MAGRDHVFGGLLYNPSQRRAEMIGRDGVHGHRGRLHRVIDAENAGSAIPSARRVTPAFTTAIGLAVAAAVPGVAEADVVSVCSGTRLPRSAVTQVVGDVLAPVIAPLESLLGGLTLGTVDLGFSGALGSAAAGRPIDLAAIDVDDRSVDLLGNPGCDSTADSYGLATQKGVSIGGNRITGLGQAGLEASAGTLDAIAIGNRAVTGGSAANAVAIGSGARVDHAGSVALGAGSLADGSTLAMPAFLVGGAAGAEVNVGGRRLTGLAAGAMPDDGVTVAQLGAVDTRLTAVDARVTTVDSRVTVVDQRVTDVDARVTANSAAITNTTTNVTQLTYNVAVLDDRAVKYTDGTKGRVVLAGTGGTRLSNLAAGVDDDDAVTVAQLAAAVSGGGQDALPYDPGEQAYNAVRGDIAQRITGVAPGALGAGSTDAVNGAQLHATNVQLAYNTSVVTALRSGTDGYMQVNNGSGYAMPVARGADSAAAGAGAVAAGDGSLAIGTRAQAIAANSVAIGSGSVADRPNVLAVGSAGAERQVAHVADATEATDAVNLRQLQGGMGAAVASANAYTDGRLAAIDMGLDTLRKDAEGGTAAAMAMAGIPQSIEAGMGMLGFGASTWQGEQAVAMGFSRASDNGRLIVRAAATYNTRSQGGANAGVGFAF